MGFCELVLNFFLFFFFIYFLFVASEERFVVGMMLLVSGLFLFEWRTEMDAWDIRTQKVTEFKFIPAISCFIK